MSQPFLDDSPMDGSLPPCSLAEFQQPRLRRGPFILKIFWDDEAPEPPHYFAAQRECQNAALFQLMQAAVGPDYAELGPILVDPCPETKEAAEANLFAFSREVRLQQSGAFDASLFQVTVVPRMRQCFGWLKLTGRDLLRLLPRKLLPPYIKVSGVRRSIRQDACYTAVVCEFVEEAENDPEVVQQVLDFFWCVGFSHIMTPKASNWKNGVLVDLSDIVHPRGYG
ncbi:hypothetical protein QBC46DRAFT_361214 [Diplogelasinospora grovesii]|uniref:Uncharacterized protein n=1 Tax=Diplogelasinospora grovesii TaxID=303347 RepID=A0AAN6NIF1_9PEZI|nr:hypothetical protein QBC46DRAFT_361214 [Diplogelasinospora grovesii]